MSKMKRLLLIGLGVTTILMAMALVIKWRQLDGQAPNWHRVIRTETGEKPTYDPIQYRAKDSRPAISDPKFIAADEAKLAAGTMGIGVAIGDEAKFYPLYILAYNQIVNDSCAGTPIACTY